MATTHPDDELLEMYVNGSLTEGMDLFVKGHLHFCPSCRKKVSLMEDIAGELLCEAGAADNLELTSYDTVLAKIADQELNETNEILPKIKGGVMPIMINNLVGKTSEEINWRFRLPGISDYQISSKNGEEISLLRAEPGAKIFQHTHEGEEATLVLSGALQDGDKVLKVGDVSVVDDNHTHNPSIAGDKPCICLIVMSGKVRFTGRFTRAFNLLT